MRGFALLLITFSSVASAQVTNYKLADHEGAATPGVSVAVSPKNNKNIAVYAAGKLMYSNDSGVTWKQSAATISDGSPGTPSLTTDAKGNFYLVYTNSSLNQVIGLSSTDDGKTWSAPIVISDLPGTEKFDVSISAHPKKEDLVATWTQVDKYGVKDDSCASDVMMSTSGSGKKWSKPIKLNQNSGDCIDQDNTIRGTHASIAPDGKIFVMWAFQSAIVYDRSYDGNMWISSDLSISTQTGGWALDMPGFGQIANTATMAIDNSPSRMNGALYMVYSDRKSGEADADIWLMRSGNRGDNWTTAARINQDEPGREQFLPRIAIDGVNGFVYILSYDRRNYTDGQTDVYLAWSVDGGSQFKEKKINDTPFTPNLSSRGHMTDYLGISAQKGLIIPVWTAINGSKQEVWTTVIKELDLNK